MEMPGVSYDQLMRVPQIVRAYERLHTPSNFFQRLLRASPTDTPVVVSQQRTFGYDVYAATRTLAPVTAPMAPPSRVGLKPVRTETATLYRMHPSITIADERVFATRPLGSFGLNTPVDASGKKYVAMQIKHVRTMMDNSIEFMLSREFRGGFGIKAAGDQFRLCDLGDADVIASNQYAIPAGNIGNPNTVMGSGEEWTSSTAPVHEHLLALSAYAAQVSGYAPKHIIMNGITAIPLFTNSILQGIGGDSYRIFDSLTNRQVPAGEALTSGQYTVVFRALPQYIFHIYNEGLIQNEVVPNVDNQIGASFDKMIPDGYAIVIPDPGEWIGFATGMEPVAYNVVDPGRVVTGLHVWRTREIDPARFDIKFLLNYVPILPIPQAVFYMDVWGATW